MLVNRHIQAESVNILGLFYYFEGARLCFDAESSNCPMKEEIPLPRCLFRNEKDKHTICATFRVRYFFFFALKCMCRRALFMHTSAQNARSRYQIDQYTCRTMGLSFHTIQPHIHPEAPLPLLCALRRHDLWLSVTFHWCCRPRYLDYRQGAGWHLICRPLTEASATCIHSPVIISAIKASEAGLANRPPLVLAIAWLIAMA